MPIPSVRKNKTMKNCKITTAVLICLMLFFLKDTSAQNKFPDWSSTPPMGWNSWDCYGPTVTEAEVKAKCQLHGQQLTEIWLAIHCC
jgi:hypothetical protein